MANGFQSIDHNHRNTHPLLTLAIHEPIFSQDLVIIVLCDLGPDYKMIDNASSSPSTILMAAQSPHFSQQCGSFSHRSSGRGRSCDCGGHGLNQLPQPPTLGQ
ncbi:hypothetical protein L3X38_042913 [Prunus dulcis]|uniref:Uncharacterized protein n=1 Tax=Prunus dulcis TaxID=3755 RepID=A0AAD4UXF8_PRUDU|nr:hypothetical protein L3X38_042913 [Prunus dulcis]